MHSAHEFKTAAEAFRRVKDWIDGSDELGKRVLRIRTSHGDEGVELRNGARLRFVARSKSSGRGFSADRLILDEAQELPVSAMGALLPTLSARPNPQVIYTGTVPSEENDAEHWTSVRDRGRAGTSKRLAWLEWTPVPPKPDAQLQDYDLDDRQAWADGNPSLGIRQTEEGFENERDSLDDDQFGRERLSIWPSGKAVGYTVITDAEWRAALDPDSKVAGQRVAFGVHVTQDRKEASISGAGQREDGDAHIGLIDQHDGTGWLVERIAELVARHEDCDVVLDSGNGAMTILPGLREIGIEPVVLSMRDVVQATGAIYDAVRQRNAHHKGDKPLTDAVATAKKRPLGGGWAWLADTSLVSATLAFHGFTTHDQRTKSQRSGRVW